VFVGNFELVFKVDMRVEVISSGLGGEKIENVEDFEVMLLSFAILDQILTILYRKP